MTDIRKNKCAGNGNIAVVIPVYNREKLVLRCLDSVAAQTLLPGQLIIVDNNSDDNSYQNVTEWIKRNDLPGVDIKLLKEMKSGASAARNCGLSQVRAEYVHFLDSDDRLESDMIETVCNAVSENRKCDLVCWKTAEYTEHGLMERRCFHKNFLKAQIYQSKICTQAFAVRVEFLRTIGGWNEDLPCWNDWELGIRILINKPRIIVIDKILTVIYPQKLSITGENRFSKAGTWEMAIDAAENAVQSSPDSEDLNKMINYRRLNLAALYKSEGKAGLGEQLKEKSLNHPLVSAWQKLVLKLIYQFTSRGGRGGYILFDALSGVKTSKNNDPVLLKNAHHKAE